MDALILSCSTGGGHNACGKAVKEELELRGHNVVMMDPYDLVSSTLSALIGNVYIKMVQHSTGLFGFIYKLGNLYRKLPFKSPVYHFNKKPAQRLGEYIDKHNFDAIIMPHLFPAELITYLKKEGHKLPATYFIATDYVCIPFTEETNCDYYIIPHKNLSLDFIKRGISEDKLVPLGIPVSSRFDVPIDKLKAKKRLKLNTDIRYHLFASGSMGAGNMVNTFKSLNSYIESTDDEGLIVICGNNTKLYKKLKNLSGSDRVRIITTTNHMAEYISACESYITKPGGLSSTEGAVIGTKILHYRPIPGCEEYNMHFFADKGLSVAINNDSQLISVLKTIKQYKNTETIKDKVSPDTEVINRNARVDVCDFIENNMTEQVKLKGAI